MAVTRANAKATATATATATEPHTSSPESNDTSPSRSTSHSETALNQGSSTTTFSSPNPEHDPEHEDDLGPEDDIWPSDPAILIPRLPNDELIIPRLRIQAVYRAANVVLRYQEKYLQVAFGLADASRGEIEETVGYEKTEALLAFSRAQRRSIMESRWEDVANLDGTDGISYLYARNRLQEARVNVRMIAERISMFEAVLEDVMASEKDLTLEMATKKVRVKCGLEEDDDDDDDFKFE